MEYYIAFDGGGTKLQAILFDSAYHVLAVSLAGGVNTNVYPDEVVKEHIRQCVDALFDAAAVRIDRISRVYTTWETDYACAIRAHCACGETELLSEGTIGLLSCGCMDGLLVLSGTGSDTFYIENAQCVDVSGGWGYILGDDGSGVWIGKESARSLLAVLEGCREPGAMAAGLMAEYNLKCTDDVFDLVYGSQSPAFTLGQFSKIVEQAAGMGDPEAIDIQKRAGTALGMTTLRLIKKRNLRGPVKVGLAGSILRRCGIVRDSLAEYLGQHYPQAEIHTPLFEPIVGCVIYGMIANGRTLNEETLDFLKQEYSKFGI